MTEPLRFDCVIIGGGPAGLTAALYLARFRRKVLVIDAGHSRAQLISHTHNHPALAGISGRELLARLREQAVSYGATLANGHVSAIFARDDGFEIVAEPQAATAAAVLVATGLTDGRLQIEGFAEAEKRGLVRYCPICDGFEVIDKRIAILGTVSDAVPKATFLRTFSRQVTIVALDGPVDDAPGPEVRIATHPTKMNVDDNAVTIAFRSAEPQSFDRVYVAAGCTVNSKIATALGAKCDSTGNLLVDSRQGTGINGLFAAGDVVSDLHQICVAEGHGAIAATSIHKYLPRNLR